MPAPSRTPRGEGRSACPSPVSSFESSVLSLAPPGDPRRLSLGHRGQTTLVVCGQTSRGLLAERDVFLRRPRVFPAPREPSFLLSLLGRRGLPETVRAVLYRGATRDLAPGESFLDQPRRRVAFEEREHDHLPPAFLDHPCLGHRLRAV